MNYIQYSTIYIPKATFLSFFGKASPSIHTHKKKSFKINLNNLSE